VAQKLKGILTALGQLTLRGHFLDSKAESRGSFTEWVYVMELLKDAQSSLSARKGRTLRTAPSTDYCSTTRGRLLVSPGASRQPVCIGRLELDMDLERFQEFMLEFAARQDAAAARHDVAIAQHDAAIAQHDTAIAQHDAEIADIRDSLKSMANTVDRLVDNQVFLQESLDVLATQTREDHAQTQESLRELERIVFRHVTDPGAHHVN
jgi:hypothetical protein